MQGLNADFFVRFGLFVRRDYLDSALCDALRREIAAAPERLSTVAAPTSDAIDLAYRKSVSAQVSEESRLRLHARMQELLPTLAKQFDAPLIGYQPSQFLRYRAGDYFRPHADNEMGGPDYVTQRRVSTVIFLNAESAEPGSDSFGGGRLTFFGLMGDSRAEGVGFPLAIEKGMLIAFRSDLIHSVTPVTVGERCSIVNWFF